jgi:hypothetical protein
VPHKKIVSAFARRQESPPIALDITDATGVFQSFVGGHNNMVDMLHHLTDGSFFEHCFCVISRP